ncbi:MAG: Ig-like domain-containing protein, partial [Gemmatimonadetes bacterium]|nr:Ig-like domain-containing protein [Gemmatimonadota bacterium]
MATASISGATITITAIAPGNASVTVTASDPGGLKGEQSLQVMVPNRAPQPTGTIPPITVPVDQAETVDASSYFAEPDGETLTYSATSSNTAAATVTVAGGTVAVTGLAKGTANVMVTATDPGGLAATQTFEVTVPNRAPLAGDPIPEMEVFVGDAAEVDVSEHFSDPDGDALVYSASSSNGNVARVSVSGATVRVEAAAQGSATVTVTATDPEGLSAESSFEVTVPNRVPLAGDPIPEMAVFVGDAESFDASEHFSDPDGDELAYSASSSNRNVARVSVSGATVRV